MSDKTEFRPDAKYYQRCWIDAWVIWGLALQLWIWAGAVAVMVASPYLAGGVALLVAPTLIFVVVAELYIRAWVSTVRYEMTDEEVIVHKGVFGKIHKIVPYRTVTNVSITRGLLDRSWLNLGNVNIQTAGAGGTGVAEERLVGLANFEEIRDAVVAHLRRYRADAGPALAGGLAGTAPPPADAPRAEASDVDEQVLEELKAIRALLEKQLP